MSEKLNVACFASGRGSNFEALLLKMESGQLHAAVRFLVTNNSGAGAAEIARAHGIPVHHISSKTNPVVADYEDRILQLMVSEGIDLIVLCGYMKALPDAVIYAPRLGAINIHPSLLPKFGGTGFYGERVHQAVLEARELESGPTVHRVDTVYDTGEILEQRSVPVLPGDTVETLASRVLLQEHDLYWRVVQRFAEGKLGPPSPFEPPAI